MIRQTARVLCLAVSMVLGASLTGLAQEASRPGTVIITAPMFWLPETTGTPVAILAPGTPVRILAREGAWYKVVFSDSRFGDETGYIAIASIRIDAGEGLEPPPTNSALTIAQRGFLEGRAFVFPQTAPNDASRAIGDALFREEVFLKPVRWLQLAAGLDLRANSHDQVENEWRLDFGDRGIRRPRAAIRRLTATIRAGGFTLDMGKQFIRWARADIQNPTDRFAPRDFLNVLDADLLPVLAIRPSLQVGDETFEAVWVPRMTPSRVPLVNQRWTVLPAGAAGISIQDGGAIIPEGAEWGARWSHAGERLEMSLSYFDGFNHLPNIDVRVLPSLDAVELTRVYPALGTYGADLALPMAWFTLKGEAAYFTSPSFTNEEYVLYVVEIERQTGEWLLDVGYIGEVVTRSRDSFPFAPDRGVARSIIGRAAYTVDPRRTLAIEGAVRQGGEGFYVRGEYSQAWGQHWRLTLAGIGIGGNEDDFLGQYRRNSHGSIGLRFSF